MKKTNPRKSRKISNEQAELRTLQKRLAQAINRAIADCLATGSTDVETVALKVERLHSMLLRRLAPIATRRDLRNQIRVKLKKTEVKPKDALAIVSQMEFAEMEEFKGIPPTITFEDKPGHVTYIPYLKTQEFERAASLRLLGESIEADQQTYLAMKSGNEFASWLVSLYGDLPLWQLYQRYKTESPKREQA